VAAGLGIVAWILASFAFENLSIPLLVAGALCVIVALCASSVRRNFIDELVARGARLDYKLEPIEMKGKDL
jgi:hypothetical protein